MSKKISSHLAVVAYSNFFDKEQVNYLYDFVQSRSSLAEAPCEAIVQRVIELVKSWNDDESQLNFDVDWDKPIFKDYTGTESMVESMTTPDHAVHPGNIDDKAPLKWTAIVMVSDRNEVQGGEMIIRNWPPTPYKDNFGNWIGDTAKPHVPQWLNERGTVVIMPSMYEHGFALVTSGTQKRVKVQFAGPQWK